MQLPPDEIAKTGEVLRKLIGGHGTSVAGVAAARGFNGIGVYGVAPEAKIAAYRLSGFRITEQKIENPTFEFNIESDVLKRHREEVAIYNNSRGAFPHHLTLLNEDTQGEIEKGLMGRYGLGNIFVEASGNERKERANTNHHNRKNSRHVIVVSASSKDGSATDYSNPGATVMVNAPCDGIPTTDRLGDEGYNPWEGKNYYDDTNYYSLFGGTSAAAPVVSGVVALMLQAEPTLNWRDVQRILIETAEKNPGVHWENLKNAAGYSHSYDYGFGRVNAKKAVETALTWKKHPLPDEIKAPIIGKNKEKEKIPPQKEIKKEIEIKENINIEFVEVYLDVQHHHWCEIEVELIAPEPHYTKSILASESTCVTDKMYPWEPYGFKNWRFGSLRHIGELSQGVWTLVIRNKGNSEAKFNQWRIMLYGTEIATPPYVKEVKAFLAPEQPAYHSGWTLADGQLTWTAFTPSSALPPGAPFTLQVSASQPMKSIGVQVAGTTYPLTAIAESNDTIWEAQVALPDTHGEQEYGMTITGVDANDVPLLAFENSQPKILPQIVASGAWICPTSNVVAASSSSREGSSASAQDDPTTQTCAVPSAAGDTAHRLRVSPPVMTWKITTPGNSVCVFEQGGVACQMQASAPEEGQPAPPAKPVAGRAILRPVGGNQSDPSVQSLLLDDVGVPSVTHAGQHFLSNGDLEFVVEPDSDDVNLCGEESVSGDCDSPPPPQPITASIVMRVKKTVHEAEDICEVTATYQQRAYRLEIQPASLCRSVQEFEERAEASAVCGWSAASAYEWLSMGTISSTISFKGPLGISDYAGYWQHEYFEKAHDFCAVGYQSRPNPWLHRCEVGLFGGAPAPVSNDKRIHYWYAGKSSISCAGWRSLVVRWGYGMNGSATIRAFTSDGKEITLEGFDEITITSEYEMKMPLVSCTYTQQPEGALALPIKNIVVPLSPIGTSVSKTLRGNAQ